MTKEKINASVDGRSYTAEVEADLNSKAYALFGSGVGKSFLQYLENITTNNIVLNGSQLVFEGNLENAYETFFTAVEPTADNVVSLPNQSGVLATEGDNLAFSIVFGG